jgi:cellulose 1,4-beta-cellobiosidase
MFLQAITDIIRRHNTTAFAVVLEPNWVGTLVNYRTGLCPRLTDAYKTGIPYALQKFDLMNVVTYIDAGNGRILGQEDTVKLTADLIATYYLIAGKPANVRGIATNVGSFNSL